MTSIEPGQRWRTRNPPPHEYVTINRVWPGNWLNPWVEVVGPVGLIILRARDLTRDYHLHHDPQEEQ